MSNEYTLKITTEQASEMPMVDLAFELLKSANTPFYYRDLMAEIAKIKGLSDDQCHASDRPTIYGNQYRWTFCLCRYNLWGLKRWYPVEKSDDAVGNAKRPRIINDEDDDLDEDVYAEEEDTYAEEDEFDTFGTETEEGRRRGRGY